MKKRAIISLLFIFMITSFSLVGIMPSETVQALTVDHKYTDVGVDKVWKITFEKKLKGSIDNINRINVYDEYFNLIDTTKYYADNNQTIVIKPRADFKKASTYYIIIDRDLEASNGELIKGEYKIQFDTVGKKESKPTTEKEEIKVKELRVTLDPGQHFQEYVEGNGLVGKDVNLEIAKMVGEKLKKEGIDVTYTRTGDSVSWDKPEEDMKKRAQIANKFNSDYMVSIYCNLSDTETSNGIETYYLDSRNKDQKFAEEIQAKIIKNTSAFDRGAKSRSEFELFQELDMPGIIVEAGFLTNKEDSQNLKKDSYKESIAQAIFEVLLSKAETKTIVKEVETEPEDTSVKIKSIKREIKVGEDFELPKFLTATYSSGKKVEFDVTWNRENFNIYKPGTYYSYGVFNPKGEDMVVECKVIVTGTAIAEPDKKDEDIKLPVDNSDDKKEDPKDDSKDEVKEDPKDDSKDKPKDDPKEDPKEDQKEDTSNKDPHEKHVVTINASRGGSDKGVVEHGITEKNLNLDIALKAGKILESNGYEVIYTRDSDHITWNSSNEIVKRVEISDKNKSELMINIGANAVDSQDPKGVETYYREGNKNGQRAARLIQDAIIQKTGATYRGIKSNTTLNTLKLSKAPAIWVAVGFLSNEEEAKNLKDEKYVESIAKGIANAVGDYFSGEHVELKDENHVKEITKRINAGENFILPDKVDVIMGSSGEKKVEVKWDNNDMMNAQPGVYKFEGVIEGTNDKVALTLIVGSTVDTGYTVVLDPGHGGYDSGAIGYTKMREKDIALSVSLMVGDYLVRNGVDVQYTRTSDKVSWPSNESADLKERTKLANSYDGDLFVSIHLNSIYDTSINGIETYAFYGSSDGYILASFIQNELIKYTGGYNRGIKQRKFYVIKYSDVPAALVELGFISNKEEESKFKTEEGQRKYARAVASGIMKKLGISNFDVTD